MTSPVPPPTAHAKELKAIDDVSTKVNGIERDLHALRARIADYSTALFACLWRQRAPSSASPSASASASASSPASLRAVAYRSKMDAHWADEALMKCLFALDNVFGDDAVKAKRKEQVTRIKPLIAAAEALGARVRRLERFLKRLPPSPPVSPADAATDATATTATATTATTTTTTTTAAAADAKDTKAPSPTPMDTTTTTTAPAPKESPKKSAAAAPEAPVDHLDHKHTVPAPAAPAAKAGTPPASRPHSPVLAPTSASASAAAPAPAPGDDDASTSSEFVIPAAIKAQWPRLRPEFHTATDPLTGAIRLTADLSGVSADDLSVSLGDDHTTLTVRGLLRPVKRKPKAPAKRRAAPTAWWFMGGYHDEDDAEPEDDVDDEQPFGWFEEQFALPPRLGLDTARAERVFSGGRLTVVLPRAQRPPSPPKVAPAVPRYAYSTGPYGYPAAAQPRRAMFNPFFGGGWF